MLSATPAETAAFLKQKLPTEIIGIICGLSDFETHTALRSTCSSVRHYVPLRRVAGFEEYKNLIELYNIKGLWCNKESEKRRVFQERIHLDLHHEELTQDQVKYLQKYELFYELSRISRKILDHPESYKGIDLLFDDCFFLTSAIRVDDLDFLIRLLKVPLMNPAAGRNLAIRNAARYGRLEIQDPRVDPSDCENSAIEWASRNGHKLVVQALLQDPRVDPSDRRNYAVRSASRNIHVAVVHELLQDQRVDPSDDHTYAIRWTSRCCAGIVARPKSPFV